jgi:hypothetical protein
MCVELYIIIDLPKRNFFKADSSFVVFYSVICSLLRSKFFAWLCFRIRRIYSFFFFFFRHLSCFPCSHSQHFSTHTVGLRFHVYPYWDCCHNCARAQRKHCWSPGNWFYETRFAFNYVPCVLYSWKTGRLEHSLLFMWRNGKIENVVHFYVSEKANRGRK